MRTIGYFIVSKAGYACIKDDEICTNGDKPTIYSTIGEAFKVASKINSILGTDTFKVFSTYKSE